MGWTSQALLVQPFSAALGQKKMEFGMKLTVLIFTTISSLAGCSAAGVVNSSDPNVKMSQALELMKHDRQIPAERLMKEALTVFVESSNFEGGRFATFQLANLYSDQGKIEEACSNYDASDLQHLKAKAENPKEKYYVMAPYNDWSEMVVALKNKIGC